MLIVGGGNIYASGYVRGGTSLCITSDCRTSWSIGGSVMYIRNLNNTQELSASKYYDSNDSSSSYFLGPANELSAKF